MKDKNKKGYFVFFGPANVGKSTMIGYILSKDKTQQELLQQEDKFKAKIGNDYRQDRFYSYFVDDAQDEYKKNSDNQMGTTYGTSKYTHIQDIGDFVLIDTPGGDNYQIQRYKGLSLANIGVFAIEIQQLLDMQNTMIENDMQHIKLIRDFFSSWYVWQKLHGAENTIILLTKYDLCKGKDNYETAKSVLSEIIGDAINTVTIIPTSIKCQLGARQDTNVFTKLNENWYNGKTLEQAIKDKNENLSQNEATENLLIFYNREYNVKNVGQTIKWKIESGMISTKDKLQIAPVLLKNETYKSVSATIKSIQINEGTVESGETGDIISTALSNIVDDNSTIQKKEVTICKTAIITNKDRKIKIGNKITASINIDNCTGREFCVINQVYTNENVRFLWYGRLLHPHIESIDSSQENKIVFVLKLDENTEREGRYIALPEDLLPKRTLLQIIRRQVDFHSELPSNYNCEVTDIEEDSD